MALEVGSRKVLSSVPEEKVLERAACYQACFEVLPTELCVLGQVFYHCHALMFLWGMAVADVKNDSS